MRKKVEATIPIIFPLLFLIIFEQKKKIIIDVKIEKITFTLLVAISPVTKRNTIDNKKTYIGGCHNATIIGCCSEW